MLSIISILSLVATYIMAGKSVAGILILVVMVTENMCAGQQIPEDFVERLQNTSKFLLEMEVHDKVQDVLMRYMRQFSVSDSMPMRTKSGVISVPISPEILINMRNLAEVSIGIEEQRNALIGKKYDFRTITHAFQFVYNSVILLDKYVDAVNASFTRHKDIEHPALLAFYHDIKDDKNMVKRDDVHAIVDMIVTLLDEANLSLVDIQNGNIFIDDEDKLTPDDCMHIAQFVRKINTTYSALFYQAATMKTEAILPRAPSDEEVRTPVPSYLTLYILFGYSPLNIMFG